MTEQLRSRANDILGAVLDLPAGEREAFVEHACGGDAALQKLVSRLLGHAAQLDGYMENTAPLVAELGRARFVAPQAGARIGNWLTVREIGRGGMGVVMLVERADGSVRQTAALKIIQDGAASDIALTRFYGERQILANLNHPDIARLIDAGSTDDGRPYFVMEYCDGVPIDEYCAAMALTLAQRIELFARVCHAVHYAHQHLIIHRDLKPANILVARDGTIKLLDFGIAKLQDREGGDADGGAASWLLTPMFASPEQLAGTPLTISTDIYSLGVVLYGLLTGRAPYAGSTGSALEMLRQLERQAPTPPSEAVTGKASQLATRASSERILASDHVLAQGQRLARQLRGDLDNILLKAIQRDPATRYASADAFARDLRRFLNHEPVQATPPSWLYRVKKVTQRYPLGVVASAAAVVSLVLGAGIALFEAHGAEQARAAAEKHFDQTHMLARTMLFDVNDTLEKGPTVAREKLVVTALIYLKELAADAALKPGLKRDVASAYERIGDVVGNQVGANLGRTKEAQAHYLSALALRQSLTNTVAPTLDDLTGLREVHQRLGDIDWSQGKVAQARTHYDAAMAAAKSVFERTGKQADQIEWFSRRRYSAAILYSRGQPNAGQLPQAIEQFAHLRADLAAFLREHPGNDDVLKVYVPVLSQSVDLSRVTGDLPGARAASLLSLELAEKKLQQTPDDPRWRRQLGVTERQIGDILIEQGENAAGLAHIRKALALRETVAKADPGNERAARDVAIGRSALADAMVAIGDYGAAQTEFAAARDTFAAQAAKNPANAALSSGVLQLELALADAQYMNGQAQQALATLAALRRMMDAARKKTGDDGAFDASLAMLDAQIRARHDRAARAAAYVVAQAALPVLLKQSESDPLDLYQLRGGALARQKIGEIGLLAGQAESACPYLKQAAGRYASFAARGQLNAMDKRYQSQVQKLLVQCAG
ncbi:MAG: serine/threonine-protein kinase [Pseudomonadota bacterium]|nr:serine/threonine-protein kinase [Pseudomonadota bacterium]